MGSAIEVYSVVGPYLFFGEFMEILRKGDLEKLCDKKKFSCEKCGCVFIARKTEYSGVSQMEWLDYNSSFKCKCPTCGNFVYE